MIRMQTDSGTACEESRGTVQSATVTASTRTAMLSVFPMWLSWSFRRLRGQMKTEANVFLVRRPVPSEVAFQAKE